MTKSNLSVCLFVFGLSFQVLALTENSQNLTTVLPQKVVIQQDEVVLPEVTPGEPAFQKVEVNQATRKLEVKQGNQSVEIKQSPSTVEEKQTGPIIESMPSVEVQQTVIVEKSVETKAVVVEQKVESTTKAESISGTSGGSIVVEQSPTSTSVTKNKLEARPKEKRTPDLALSIHYSTIGRFVFSEGTQTVGTTKTKLAGDFNVRTTMGFALSGWNTRRHSWGYMGGISLDAPREMSPLQWTSVASGPAIFSGGMGSTMYLALLEGNAVYRIEDVYFLSGLNLSLPGYKKASSEPGTTTLRGGLGFQTGIGAFANESVSFEAMYKVISIGVNYKDPSVEFDSRSVLSDGFQFQTKFTF